MLQGIFYEERTFVAHFICK